MKIRPFRIDFPEEELDDLRRRLRATRWPKAVPAGGGWDYGAEMGYMQELTDYWLHKYDWRAEERRLNQFRQFKADVKGIGVHYIHEEGKGPNPMPLLLMHGFPWSVATLARIIPLLTDPAAHGGDPADAFTVVAPSLIGFGFSDAPQQQGFSFERQADWLRDLMVDVLGYRRFGAQGGDWGGIICTPLGYKYPRDLIGLHLSYMGVMIRQEAEADPNILRGFGLEGAPIRPADPDSLFFWKTFEKWCLEEGGYRHIQMTRPQSLAYGLSDSPVGQAAWFVEKYRAWGDCDGDVEKMFDKDYLITNTMLYWIPNSFSSAIRIYYESQHHQWKLKPGDRVTVPTGFAAFPKEHTPIVKSRAAAYFNMTRFTEMPRGGHFAPYEAPADLAEEVQAFFRPLRAAEAAGG